MPFWKAPFKNATPLHLHARICRCFSLHWSTRVKGVCFLQKEAKLGAEENTFFYDEERKMWRERGAEVPAAAAPLPPPPTAARQPGSAAVTSGPLLECLKQIL